MRIFECLKRRFRRIHTQPDVPGLCAATLQMISLACANRALLTDCSAQTSRFVGQESVDHPRDLRLAPGERL